MTSAALISEFESRGSRAGSALLFDEPTALALIERAEQEFVAVVDVDQVSPSLTHLYQPLETHALTEPERIASWHQARLFVRSLSGRGLYFEVALEPSYATFFAKLKYLFRTGAAWAPGSRAGDETLQ